MLCTVMFVRAPISSFAHFLGKHPVMLEIVKLPVPNRCQPCRPLRPPPKYRLGGVVHNPHGGVRSISMSMYLGQWDVSLSPIQQTVLTEIHIMQNTIVHNCSREGGTSSSTVMLQQSQQSNTFRIKEKNILTSRAVFANHLPSIGVLTENSGSAGCVRGGREEYAVISSFLYPFMVLFCSDTGLFSPCRRHLTLYLQGIASDLSPLLSRTVPYT